MKRMVPNSVILCDLLVSYLKDTHYKLISRVNDSHSSVSRIQAENQIKEAKIQDHETQIQGLERELAMKTTSLKDHDEIVAGLKHECGYLIRLLIIYFR